MIFYAINDNSFTTRFIDKISNDTVQHWLPTFLNYRCPVFNCKYGLEIDLMIGVCHKGALMMVQKCEVVKTEILKIRRETMKNLGQNTKKTLKKR